MHISDLCSVRSRLWVQSADIQFLSPHALQLDVVHRAGPTLVLAALALRPFLVLARRLKASKSKQMSIANRINILQTTVFISFQSEISCAWPSSPSSAAHVVEDGWRHQRLDTS